MRDVCFNEWRVKITYFLMNSTMIIYPDLDECGWVFILGDDESKVMGMSDTFIEITFNEIFFIVVL